MASVPGSRSREGLTLSEEVTFTPRLIAVDLKGSLGALPECGELYAKISILKEDKLSNYWTGGWRISDLQGGAVYEE